MSPAAVRFVSYEPALEAVDFMPWLPDWLVRDKVDWLIDGGESGRGARPFDLDWARSTVEQGRAAGVPVFCKQLGAKPFAMVRDELEDHPVKLRDGHGGDWSEWPSELRVREFPIRTGNADRGLS